MPPSPTPKKKYIYIDRYIYIYIYIYRERERERSGWFQDLDQRWLVVGKIIYTIIPKDILHTRLVVPGDKHILYTNKNYTKTGGTAVDLGSIIDT